MKIAAVLVDQRGASAGFFLLGLRYRHGRMNFMRAFGSGPGLCRLSGNLYLCPTLCPRWHTSGTHVLLMCKSILSYSKYSAYLSQMRRADERIRTADLLITSARSVVAERCRDLETSPRQRVFCSLYCLLLQGVACGLGSNHGQASDANVPITSVRIAG
jgi:hypothetical protein